MGVKMTNAQTNALLETIAKRIEERKDITPKDAADIVRESKTNAQNKDKVYDKK